MEPLPGNGLIKSVTAFNNLSNNSRQQFRRPIILTPDDDHIGQNM
jgi:hypothetical protein